MPTELFYRSANDDKKITRRVEFVGHGHDGRPMGRVYNEKGTAITVRNLNSREIKALGRMNNLAESDPGFVGTYDPYRSVIRSLSAPPQSDRRGGQKGQLIELGTLVIAEIKRRPAVSWFKTGVTNRSGLF